MLPYLLTMLLALGITYAVTPVVTRLCRALGAVDEPGRRRINLKRVPNMGGLAIFTGFVSAILIGPAGAGEHPGIILGASFILILGIVDDISGLSPRLKLLGQGGAAFILIFTGVSIEFISNPLTGGIIHLGVWSIPLTLFWTVGIVNTLNLIDGLDGLAAGISTIAAITLFAVSLQEGRIASAFMTAALAGSALAFLRFNFHPARIFLGDGGAMLVGYLLAAISITGALKSAAAVTVFVPVLALGIPIFDTAFAILRRLYNSRPIYKADHGHLHHRLLALGWSQKQVAIVVYAISSLLGGLAVLVNGLNFQNGLIIMLVVASSLIYGFWRLGVFTVRVPGKGSKLGGDSRQQEK